MIRSNSGCWTCRIRHKKCDEQKPTCRACTSRNIPCHGYSEKPSWLDGGDREREEVYHIKAAVKANLKQRRSSGSHAGQALRSTKSPGGGSVGEANSGDASLSNAPPNPAHQYYSIKLSEEPQYSPPSGQTASQREAGSPSLLSETVPSYRESELLMHYLDYVFPLQFRFHTPDSSSGGRGWLLWLLVKTGPLYHAALSLSALHQYALIGHDSGDQYGELTGYHAQALKDLQIFLRKIQESGNLDVLSQHIGILACGVSLISFELFRGGVNDWNPHLNALVSLPLMATAHALHDTSTRPPSTFLASEQATPNSSNWQTAALRFLIPVVSWFDLLSCASTRDAPKLPYRVLLEDNTIDLESVMGCQNWVMRLIGDLATLNAWKTKERQSGVLSMPHLVSRSREIERRLEQGLEQLELPTSLSVEEITTSTSRPYLEQPRSVTSKIVTQIFANGALVHLHTIVSGAYAALPEIRQAVSRTMAALDRTPDYQMVRGLIWPICISGCMAEPDAQIYFERIVKRAIGPSRDFGNCETILQIMQKCWSMRELDKNRDCDWRTAMTEMGICVLLV